MIEGDTVRLPNGVVYTASAGDSSDKRRCSRCGRHFKSRKAADQHIQDKHKGVGERVSVHRPDDGREPSLGSQVAEAMLARMCGEPVDPVIADMFDI
jgi:hypothetical protein